MVERESMRKRNRKILGLDPSSTVTGYAVMGDDYTLFDAGRFVPGKNDPVEVRTDAMCDDLAELLEDVVPDVIVLEWTSGKTAGRLQNRRMSGLQFYGIGLGEVRREIIHWLRSRPTDRHRLVLVPENEWTKGKGKDERAAIIARLYRQYDFTADVGHDMADAIGVARYWLERHRTIGR